MNKKQKKIIACCILYVIIFWVLYATFYFQFSAEGYRITVPLRYSFEEIADNIYVNKGYSGEIEKITDRIAEAKERDSAFFGRLKYTDDIVFIICDDNKILKKLGGENDTITVNFPFSKSYISVSDEYLNIDTLAHELSHAELHLRLSGRAMEKIPAWFDEGVATQNDYRRKYSMEAWIEKTDNGKNRVPLENMDTLSDFGGGSAADRYLKYLTAKYEVSEWIDVHHREGLLELIDRLNNGEDFYSVYGR